MQMASVTSSTFQVQVPPGVAPGSVFQANVNGHMMAVQVPAGATAGQMLAIQAPTADNPAMADYEKLLAAASRLVISGPSKKQPPVAASIALDVGDARVLLIEVHIDPKEASPKKTSPAYLKNIEPYGAYRTELKLSDGRVVMNLTHPGFSAAALTEQYSGRGMSATSVQVMDRDGPTTISFEDMDPRVRQTMGCAALCDPLLAFPKTRVTHPGSSDEAVRQGYLQIATWRVNSHRRPWDAFMLCCMVATFFSGPVCVSCCCADPDVIFELQEAGSGEAVEGVRYTERGRTCCGKSWGDHTSGNVIEFASGTSVQVRKDMVAMVAFRLSLASSMPEQSG